MILQREGNNVTLRLCPVLFRHLVSACLLPSFSSIQRFKRVTQKGRSSNEYDRHRCVGY
jgi:hypothetical protein